MEFGTGTPGVFGRVSPVIRLFLRKRIIEWEQSDDGHRDKHVRVDKSQKQTLCHRSGKDRAVAHDRQPHPTPDSQHKTKELKKCPLFLALGDEHDRRDDHKNHDQPYHHWPR